MTRDTGSEPSGDPRIPELDRERFDALVAAHRAQLRAVVRRMIGHPEDTEDVTQEALLKAWNAREGFRGDASFGTWLCAIGTRTAIDHLRQSRRWRAHAQVAYANACASSDVLGAEVGGALTAPDFAYEVKEHIAYCFTCVGRSLAPEEHAALVLRDVMDLSTREAAQAIGASESVLRHTLTRARSVMTSTYEGLCALVNKQGVCYQCKGLRDATPPDRRGDTVPALESLEKRLAIVRHANIDNGMTQVLHDLFWRRTKEIEETGEISDAPSTDCGQD